MKKADGKLTEAEEQQLQSAQQYVRENEARILQDKQKLANAELVTKTFDDQMALLNNQSNILSTITSAFSGIVSIATVLFGLYQ